jgi:carboxypeptidase family protein
MRTTPLILALWAAVGLAGLLAACDNNSTVSPAQTSSPTPTPVVTTTSVEIIGPGSMAPGATAQFTAVAQRSDGTTLDVTNVAQWRSLNLFNTSALSISVTGLATASNVGEALVQVTHANRTSSRTITVLPTGTYRIVGFVGEADLQTAPVVGARVEVTEPTAGPSMMTGNDGRYRLYGVPSGTVQMRVTKEGYQPNYTDLVVADHQTQNFALTLAASRPDVSGVYTLTVTADGACSARLPEQARTRTYAAVVTQLGPQVDVTLTGATFLLNSAGKGNRFGGRIEPGQVVFTLDPYHPSFYYYAYGGYGDIVDQLGPTSYLVINGLVATPVSPSRLNGALDGSFVWSSRQPASRAGGAFAECASANHQFVMSR